MQNTQRILLVAAAAAVLILGFVLANSGGSTESAKPVTRHLRVIVAAGKPGAAQKLTAHQGDTIDLRVESPVADEIHIHGYDLHQQVAAGGVASFNFLARIAGNFVIELESRAEQIAALSVKA